jgi:peptidyl-prolyl cis-trans isomerase C
MVSLVIIGVARGQPVPERSPSLFAPVDPLKPAFDTTRHIFDSSEGGHKGDATVVAEVDGRPIFLSDVADVIRSLPPVMAAAPFDVLQPVVLEQLITEQALVISAQEKNLDADPIVRRRLRAATNRVLANEYLDREIEDKITEKMLLDRYQSEIAGKPGAVEVRGRIIMLLTEQEALNTLAELRAGADFGDLARRVSRDNSAGAAGDLGFNVRTVLNPELGAVMFALAPGETGTYPVNALGSWYLVRTEERRTRPTPTFSEVRDQLKGRIKQERVTPMTAALLNGMKVRRFDLMGNEIGK